MVSEFKKAQAEMAERAKSAVVTEDELRVFCRQHMAGFKVPKAIVFGLVILVGPLLLPQGLITPERLRQLRRLLQRATTP